MADQALRELKQRYELLSSSYFNGKQFCFKFCCFLCFLAARTLGENFEILFPTFAVNVALQAIEEVSQDLVILEQGAFTDAEKLFFLDEGLQQVLRQLLGVHFR
jgi:hypothetical protein